MSPDQRTHAPEFAAPPRAGVRKSLGRQWPLHCLSRGAASSSVRSCLLLLVLCCVVPATLGAALLILQAYRDGLGSQRDRAVAVSRAVLTEVDERLRGATAALQALATSPALEQGDLAAFHAQAMRAMPFQHGNTLVLSDLDGQQLVNALVPFGQPLPRHGNVSLQRRAIESGLPAVSDLFVGGVTRRPLVAVEVPVRVGDKTPYTLAMGFLPERLGTILANLQPGAEWVIAIFDRTGTVLARTHNAERFIGSQGAPALVDLMRREDQGLLEVDTLEGTPVLAAFVRSRVTGWTVAVGVPQQLLLSRLQRWIATLVVASMAVLALAVVMAAAIGRHISASIDALTGPAEALGGGEPVSVGRLPLREADTVGLALSRASALLQARTLERDQATRDTEVARVEARRMEHAASHDPLTDLTNRLHFEQLLTQRLQRCKETGGHLSIFYIDLDDFKPVNDTHGHAMGDKLLRSFAARLLSGVRSTDTVARLGGDEFAVLLEGLARHEALHIAAALRERLSMPYAIDDVQLHVTACIGVAGHPEDGVSADALLCAADAAMYQAKAGGKARFAVSGQGDL